MEQHCILCGQEAVYGALRPGTPVRCPVHAHRDLKAWENFTEDEAYEEGRKRADALSAEQRAHEWKIARTDLAKMEPEVDRLTSNGAVGIATYIADLVAAKKAYLRAFDAF